MNCSIRVAAPSAFSRWMATRAAWFSLYEKYTSTRPLVSRAPLTRPAKSTPYLRKRRPRPHGLRHLTSGRLPAARPF
jgi:hypothetical protein